MEPLSIPEAAVRAIHAELLREHGGLAGATRPGALEAALARAPQRYSYGDAPPSLAELAAAYGFGLAKGHCFSDGNKRVALACIDVSLRMNGRELTASEEDAVTTIQSLAAGDLSESQLAAWIEANSRASPRQSP